MSPTQEKTILHLVLRLVPLLGALAVVTDPREGSHLCPLIYGPLDGPARPTPLVPQGRPLCALLHRR